MEDKSTYRPLHHVAPKGRGKEILLSSFSFPNALPTNVDEIEVTARTGPAQPQQPETVANSQPGDSVTISLAAQAQSLYEAGDTVSSISASLGISVSMIDSFLNISQPTAVPTTIPVHASTPAPASTHVAKA